MRVAIAGLPGTGKTTAARLVAEGLGLPLLSAGGLFRAMAEEKGLSLDEMGAMAERDDAIDRQLDQRMAREARKAPAVLEGRLTAWVCKEFRIPAFKVRLDAPERVRAERIAKRESLTLEKALADNRRREQSEKTRYLRYYGVDIGDPRLYDLALDTGAIPPDEVAGRIIEGVRKHGQP